MQLAASFDARFPQTVPYVFNEAIVAEENVEDSELGALGHASVIGQGLAHVVAQACRVLHVVAPESRTKPIEVYEFAVWLHEVVALSRFVDTTAHAAHDLARRAGDKLGRVVEGGPRRRSRGVGAVPRLVVVLELVRRQPGKLIAAVAREIFVVRLSDVV